MPDIASATTMTTAMAPRSADRDAAPLIESTVT